MRALFKLFLDICLLRKGPQDIPAAAVLLRLTLACYGLTALLGLPAMLGFGVALALLAIDMALQAGLTYGALYLRGSIGRFQQTLTALYGCGALLQILFAPVQLWLDREIAGQGSPALPQLVWLGLFAWSIAVMSHILRHALSIPLWGGVLCSSAYIFVYWTLSDWLYPLS